MGEIYDNYLAPWIVRENGRVQAASGDSRVAEFLDERVVMRTQFNTYPSIFEIRKDERLWPSWSLSLAPQKLLSPLPSEVLEPCFHQSKRKIIITRLSTQYWPCGK